MTKTTYRDSSFGRRFDHLFEVSSFFIDREPVIESLKRGIPVRPTAGLPHFGYAFDWQPRIRDADALFFLDLWRKLEQWTKESSAIK